MGFTITDTKDTFDSFIAKDYIPEELRKSLANAAILMVPFDNLRDTPKPIFPIGTESIFQYFKENLPTEYPIDICIADEDYYEFAFYNDYKRLGNFVIISVAIPVFVSVFSTYIYDTYIKQDESKPQIQIIDKSNNVIVTNHISTLADKKYLEPTHVKFSITVVDTAGVSKNISYEGPAAEVDTVLKSLREYGK